MEELQKRLSVEGEADLREADLRGRELRKGEEWRKRDSGKGKAAKDELRSCEKGWSAKEWLPAICKTGRERKVSKEGESGAAKEGWSGTAQGS